MDLKYIKNQTETTAQMFLFAPIGGGGINAQQFVNELQFLDSLGLESIDVHINSGGGSVIEGFGIFGAIRSMKTPVNTIIEGVAASIAGIIAMAGEKRSISDFGRLMVHDPSFGGGQNPSAKDKAVLDTIKDSLIKILANNSSLDEGEIFDKMSVETWFSADEAHGFGFVDSIFSTERQKDEIKNLDINEVLNLVNDNNSEIKTDNMLKDINNHLKLDSSTDEAGVIEVIKTLENNVLEAEVKTEELTNELTKTKEEHTAEVEDLNNDLNEANKTIATLTVDNAITAGKFSKEKREELIENATKNLDGFNVLAEAVTVKAVSIIDSLKTDEVIETKKTFREMSKNEPKALLNLLKNDFAEYSKLYKEEYGVEPTK